MFFFRQRANMPRRKSGGRTNNQPEPKLPKARSLSGRFQRKVGLKGGACAGRGSGKLPALQHRSFPLPHRD